MRRLRVLHVITGLRAGGAEQQLVSLLRHTRHDAEVAVLYAAGVMADELRRDGTTVHELDRPSRLDPRAVTDLVRLLRRGRFDVAHTHLYRACLHGRLAARLAGTPAIVATEHSLSATQLEGRPPTRSVRALYLLGERAGHHTVAVSDETRRHLLDWGVARDRVSVVRNGVESHRYRFDPAARRRVRRQLDLGDDEVVIGSVGRLHPGKRLDVLLDAAAPLLHDGMRALIVGDGDHADELRARASRLGVADRVVWTGERTDVPALLSAMDVYAAPSTVETFGLAVVEALCSGLPAVVDSCPAIDGLALPAVRRSHDRSSLRAGLAELGATAPTDRDPPSSLLAHLDMRAVADAIDDLYQNVWDGTRSGGTVATPVAGEDGGSVDGGRARRRAGPVREATAPGAAVADRTGRRHGRARGLLDDVGAGRPDR